MNVEAGRRKRDFQRQAGLPHRAARRMRLRERGARALALVHVLRVAIEAHLHRSHRQTREAGRDLPVEALTVGFDLEPDARVAQRLGEREEMGHDKRLTAAQHDVRNRVANDILGKGHCFIGVQLVRQPLSGRRLGAAMQAAEVAVARDLPRDEQRRLETVDAVHHGNRRQPCSRMPPVNSVTATR